MLPDCARCRRRSRTSTRTTPRPGLITLKAKGTLDDSNIACKVETGRALAVAGLHPATGGSGMELCSGDMLLEALVACAGVTVKAVATALDIPLNIGPRVGRRRPRFPRHARRRQGRAGRLCADPPALRPRHRGAAGQTRPTAQADRALLRGLPDHQKRSAGGRDQLALRFCHTRHSGPAAGRAEPRRAPAC